MAMDEEPVTQPKYGRGQNPLSLANLKPPWAKGVTGNSKGVTGPMIGPAIRRFAALSLEQLQALWSLSPKSITVAEAIAITTLIDALTTGSFTSGAKSREQVMDRLDGPVRPTIEVQVGVEVRLTWADGTDA